MASAKVAPNSLARIHHHGRQASKQAVILSFRLAIDWGPTTAGQKSTRINPARSLFLGSFFFSFSFFCLQKTEHLVWLIAAANRQRLDLSLSLLFYSLPVPGSPGRHYRFVIIKITSIKRPVDGHRHNGPEWRHWEEGEEKHSLNAAK